MIVTLSERRFSEQIRQLEGLDPSMTIEEITDRLQFCAARLFDHIRQNHGVNCVGLLSQNGGLADFQVLLAPIYSAEEQADRIAGIEMMAPNSVTIEPEDIHGLVPPGIVQTALDDAWYSYEAQLRKILPSNIGPLLERAAQKICFGANPSGEIDDPALNEELYRDFLRRSGKEDPLAAWDARDAAAQREIDAERAAYEARLARVDAD